MNSGDRVKAFFQRLGSEAQAADLGYQNWPEYQELKSHEKALVDQLLGGELVGLAVTAGGEHGGP